MAKLILTFGPTLANASYWSVQEGKVVLGCGVSKGNASAFIEALKQNLGQGRMKAMDLDYLLDVVNTEVRSSFQIVRYLGQSLKNVFQMLLNGFSQRISHKLVRPGSVDQPLISAKDC